MSTEAILALEDGTWFRGQAAGAEGVACMAAASSASVQASARINVSIQASASVSGRVGASGG